MKKKQKAILPHYCKKKQFPELHLIITTYVLLPLSIIMETEVMEGRNFICVS